MEYNTKIVEVLNSLIKTDSVAILADGGTICFLFMKICIKWTGEIDHVSIPLWFD